jgi:hypothetical protein
MTTAAQAILTPRAGLIPAHGTAPIAANQFLPKDTLVQLDASGNAVSPITSDASGLPAIGVSAASYNNKTGSEAGGTAGAIDAELEYGVFGFAYTGTTPTVGDRCYVADNQTVSTSSVNGTRGFAFICSEVRDSRAYGQIGPRGSVDSGAQQFKARGAAFTNHSLTAFTVATNTDGITYVAGDVVLLTAQTTVAENGPYVVGTVATTAPLTRPSWWKAGMAIPQGQVIQVGGDGTIYGDSEWKAFAAKAKVVDTDDPVFYPRTCKGTVTLAGGTSTYVLGSTEGLFLKSLTKSPVLLTRNTVGGTLGTDGLSAPVASRQIGVSGTASVAIFSTNDNGGNAASDTSTVDFQITNW